MSSTTLLRSKSGPLYLCCDDDDDASVDTHSRAPLPFFDVRLVTSEGGVSSSSLRAHRVVLGASCALLKSALLGADQGCSMEEDPAVLILPDYSESQVRTLLDVVYGRRRQMEDDDAVGLLRECGFRWLWDNSKEMKETKDVLKAEEEEEENVDIGDDDFEPEEEEEVEEEEEDEDDESEGEDYDDEDSNSFGESSAVAVKRGRGRPRGSRSTNTRKDKRHRRERRRLTYPSDPSNPGHFLCPLSEEGQGCTFSHPKRFAVTSHVNAVHNKVDCPHCDKRLCRTTLPNHIARKHTKKPTRTCEHCPMMFYSKHELEVHRNRGHGIATVHIICESCGRDFSSKDVYRRHQYRCLKSEVGGGGRGGTGGASSSLKDRVPYACKIDPGDPTACPAEGCQFRNKSSTAIKKHYRIKHERQICQHCGREYTYYGMKEHIAKEHTKDLKFECDACSEKFFNEGYLREHKEREHIRELNYVCEQCGKGFFSRKLVARHKNEVHNQCKHNPCPLCNTVYRNRKSLRNHMTSTHHAKLAPKR